MNLHFKVLVEKGANLAARDSWYQTPLMYCMITQWFEIAEILLSQGQDIIDIGDMYGRTALHIAVKNAAVEGIRVTHTFYTYLYNLHTLYFKVFNQLTYHITSFSHVFFKSC